MKTNNKPKKVTTKVTLKNAETVGFFDPKTNIVYISGCSKWSARRAKVEGGNYVKVKISIPHLRTLIHLKELCSDRQDSRRIKTSKS